MKFENPRPPPAPQTAAGLVNEMFGVMDSCPGLYQGMLRYWLMWRLPQLVDCVRGASGLKFHLCGSYRGLLDNFIRLFVLPDLLVVGQCGHVLRYEMLHYEHPLDCSWPNIDGTHPNPAIIGGKPDRPIVDGVVKFADEWIRPLGASGRVVFAPFTTMLAEPMPTHISAEALEIVLKGAIANAKPEGLPAKTLRDAMEKAAAEFRNHPESESIPLAPPVELEDEKGRPLFDPARMKLEYGRFFWPDSPISQPDPSWQPADILSFEFFMSAHLGTMLLVAGDCCDAVPSPTHSFNLRVPYVEGLKPETLAGAIAADPEAFGDFRKVMTTALLEAVSARGSEAYSKKLEQIQRDIVDSGVEKLNRKWKEFRQKRHLRLADYTIKSISITVGLYLTYSPVGLVALFGTPLSSVLAERMKRLDEKGELRKDPMYFIWKIGH